jgi:ribonucleoside-triphosphate reductase
LYYNKSPLDIPTDINWRHKQLKSNSGIKALSGVYKITYIPQDVSYIGSSKNIQQRIRDHKKDIRHTGGLDCGLFFGDANIDNYSFEVIEYTDDYKDAEKKYIQLIPNANYKGISSKFYKNVGITKGRGSDTRPNIVMNPNIPQEYISLEDFDYKVLDRNNQWVKIKHIFKNDKMNTPLMMHITYRENDKVYTLCCTEDHPLWNGERFVRADNFKVGDYLYRADELALEVIEIKYHTDRVDSYDIGTETGSFIGSDIIMHNCRTANGWDINGFGQLKDGRGNICPVTVIMPTLAMEVKETLVGQSENLIESFLEYLSKKIDEAKDMLIERFNWICSQNPKSASFMWENNTMAGYIPEEGIRSALKHGTLAIGQIGLAETLQILIGADHTTKEGMELAKRIENLFKVKCAEFKEKYKLNFGVYFSPAENLCYTSMKKFKKRFGIIPNISDRKYFTNSMHVPVWKELTPFEKIDIESQLTGYSSAGCITYVELPESAQNNIDALETIVNYAMDKDIPYFAINVPNDVCDECGYTAEMNDICPKCGSTKIKRLRRVTGYLTGNYKTAFNKGKQQETEHRVKHIK